VISYQLSVIKVGGVFYLFLSRCQRPKGPGPFVVGDLSPH